MTFRWLKHYLPQSIFGRTALIIAVPMVLLQVVVMVLFVQRHFEDVTAQMTRNLIRELELIAQITNDAETVTEAEAMMAPLLPSLELSIAFVPPQEVPKVNSRMWYDLSGRTVIATLESTMPGLLAVSLAQDRMVSAYLSTDFGPARVTFARRRVSASAPHQLLVIMMGFGLLLVAVAFVYLRNQLKPVSRLADAATAFGLGQTPRYSPSGAKELRAAGRAFLDMRARIERHIEQRTLMLSGVSHDLRTPLTRMKLELSMMDPADAAPLLRDVAEMEGLVNSFLDFAGDMASVENAELDPRGLVEEIVHDAERAGQAVTLYESEGSGTVMLRERGMRRALENLIGNAVRYGTRAEVSVRLLPNQLRIAVEDDGPGIPPGQRADALKPFARLDPARNQNKGSGVGLGLAIASDVARAHGGQLILDDSARLGGLRAEIRIGR
ncbi:MAG: ATP-binding protein [Marinibacterium sp.]|nr:ATP-binding protein [Marinibacterium sp.]